MTISRTSAQALAAFVARERPGWDHAGTVAAIMRASTLGSPLAIGAALCRLAENPDLRTPAMLAEPGPHWAGTTVAARKPPTMCGVHPGERALNCKRCEDEATPPSDGWRDVHSVDVYTDGDQRTYGYDCLDCGRGRNGFDSFAAADQAAMRHAADPS